MEHSSQPGLRLCDLVMKGGITSGVVYPRAVARLSQHYRFMSIGGTSAGAIAAACTAAAEYQRLTTGSCAGFDALRTLARELGENGKLLSLFQPAPTCRSVFRLLKTMLNAKGPWRRFGLGLLGLARAFPFATFLVVALALAVYWWDRSVTASIAVGMLAWLAAMVVRVLFDVTRAVVGNDYGLCPGLTQPGLQEEALVPWLHRHIQELAGLDSATPLTFGMLWKAPDFPAWLEEHLPPDLPRKSINLQLFTTNLTHGRPYLLPFSATEKLFYKPEELKKYLPPEILDYLDELHSRNRPVGASPDAREDLRPLPQPEDFPVLLAARMSLSFPVLFSAIPLWTTDPHTDLGLLPQQRTATMERCMFSDGGISSNFPVHLFDSLLPMWPTFGIDLEVAGERSKGQKPADDRDLVELPSEYLQGMQEVWQRFGIAPGNFGKLAGFLGAIIRTMQNWNDNMLRRMPGVRDRVARLGLYDNEGGLNLDMAPDLIERLGLRGEYAAEKIIARYVPDQSGAQPGWDDQRWVRMAVTMTLLNRRLATIGTALAANNPHATPYHELLRRATKLQMPGMDREMTPEQIASMLDAFAKIQAWPATGVPGPGAIFDAIPEPDLRVRPAI